MASKVFRDPLYNYVSIKLPDNAWLLDVINSQEFQRLRRIHQLGVSHFTYPGADHSRLVHSLGVMHLMDMAVDHFSRDHREMQLGIAKPMLLAAALTHDVGHGPFSHLFEPCLGIDHEDWSRRILLDPDSEVNRALRSCDASLPDSVASLIDPDNSERPAWQKYLISSQLDMDRLDYLRRDSLFSGSGYGHFDWHRLITTMELEGSSPNEWEIVWSGKAKFAIEEYVFSRYYMYQNVYLHKTTRGFEQMLQAMWRRAKTLYDGGTNVDLVSEIDNFWKAKDPTIKQYLAIEEFSVMSQIARWGGYSDEGISDLARRFMARKPFCMVEPPSMRNDLDGDNAEWEESLKKIVERTVGSERVDLYMLKDQVKPKYNQPYFPEKESDEQSVKNAIRVRNGDGAPVEVSTVMPRMQPITHAGPPLIRYYIPHEARKEALKLRQQLTSAA